MASDHLFADTWAWLVLAEAQHPQHSELMALRRSSLSRKRGWVTTDYVLDETITHLFARRPFVAARTFVEGIFKASHDGFLTIERITPPRFSRAWELRVRYRDKPRISFTDLTSFAVMSELGIRTVLTGDAHFEYTGLGFERVPRPTH